jgi:MoaA/NifB/PqqE/SkfB family radical SAM enzyme
LPEREKLANLLEPGFVYLENLASARALTHPICSALARRYVYVSPYGDLQPCCFVPISFGNIRRRPLGEILKRLWESTLMNYDSGRCLMNNPEFRKKYLNEIGAAKTLPIIFREEDA